MVNPTKENLKNWLDGIDQEKVEKSAEMEDIFPKLELPAIPEGMKRGDSVKVKILEEDPRTVKSKDFKFGDTGFCLLVEGEDGVKNNYWLNGSARYKLAVLKKKHGSLKDMVIAVWKELTILETYGETTVNNIQKIEGD